MSWLVEMFSYGFMQRALVVGVALSLMAALIGVPLVLRRSSMIGDGMSHVAFGAFAVAIVLGVAPLWIAIPAVIATSFLVLRLNEKRGMRGDVMIALLSASSLAIGVMAISLSKGVNVDLNSYLFGSILSVSWGDVWWSLGLCLLVLVGYILAYRRIFAIAFDAEFAQVMGVKVKLYNTILAVICAVVIVLGMRLLGALLISSLIVFPVCIAMQFNKSFKWTVIIAGGVAVINFVVGLVCSYLLATPTGATVVIVNLVGLLVARGLKSLE